MQDETDLRIIEILRSEARLSWKEIGARVHLSGQAVGARIRRLEDEGVITGYAALVDQARLGRPVCAYIMIHMKSNDHKAFLAFIAGAEAVVEAHRVSGGGCYLLKTQLASQEALNALLDGILAHANYGVSLSLGRVK